MEKPHKEIHFKFVKSHDFKTVRADGVWGGFTVGGKLNINFFTDTIEMPKQVTHKIVNNIMLPTPNPDVKNELTRIREIPFGITLDLQTAKGIIEWMKVKIDEFEKEQAKRKEVLNAGSR